MFEYMEIAKKTMDVLYILPIKNSRVYAKYAGHSRQKRQERAL